MHALRRIRFPLPGASPFTSYIIVAGVLLTLVWLLVRGLAPAGGLTRSFHYPLAPEANPLRFDTARIPAAGEPAADVDLAFLDEFRRPTRHYFARWRGVWFSPRAERIALWAGADDGVVVRIDGEIVIERHPAVGMHTETRSVALETGSHTLEIDHWQRGGGRSLRVRWAPAGGEPRPLRGRVFPSDPGAAGYWLSAGSALLATLVPLVWAGGAVLLLGRAAVRRVSALTVREAGARLRTAAFPALLGPAQVLLFGPWTVHATNRSQFLLPFWSLAPSWIALLALASALLATLGLLLPPRAFRRYVAGLCAAGVLLWAQGNLLVADYGVLDGGGLDLASHGHRVPVEAGLWAGMFALALLLPGAASRAAPTASALLITLQTALLLLAPLAPAEASGDSAADEWRLPPPEIHELSARRNVIHIVLDQFPTFAFSDILDADRPAFDRNWSGFTFFRDHLGAFPSTKATVPAMLTGIPWRNELPFHSYLRRDPSIFDAFGRQGYQLRSLTSYGRVHGGIGGVSGVESALRYTIPAPYGSYREYVDSASAQLLDLALFRHAPHGLKAGVYRDGQWRLQAGTTTRQGAAPKRAFGDAMFLQDFAERVSVGDEAPLYVFLHVFTPHTPLVTDAECTYTGRHMPLNLDNYLAQARCALRAVGLLLERLRQLDLYDRSAIVVTSDHGTARFPRSDSPLAAVASPAGTSLHTLELNATPLLLVKPFGADGPLRTSDAPSAVVDLPATLLDLAGLPNTLGTGTPVLALDPARGRERTYAHHSWGLGLTANTWGGSWFDVLHLFTVEGRVADPAAWRYRQALFGPARDREAQRRTHRVGLTEEQHPEPGIYRMGEYAAFFVPADTGRIAFDVRRAPGAAARSVTVRVDGEVVGRHSLSGEAWRTLAQRGAGGRVPSTIM
ncbi:MAG: sulfatase-like hydrolase/transferase [Acidobacteria bacterium]|nr:sulfatase-like hydrolase/transferase [Acidobacteriota bacterium]